MHHAPLLWKEMIGNEEIVFLHYMGAKPWMKSVQQRQNADWESEYPAYIELEKLWWKIRRGEATLKNGSLHHHLPFGPLSTYTDRYIDKKKY
jgi:lipopolysaccharide biosynthesis glycosyltransferase